MAASHLRPPARGSTCRRGVPCLHGPHLQPVDCKPGARSDSGTARTSGSVFPARFRNLSGSSRRRRSRLDHADESQPPSTSTMQIPVNTLEAVERRRLCRDGAAQLLRSGGPQLSVFPSPRSYPALLAQSAQCSTFSQYFSNAPGSWKSGLLSRSWHCLHMSSASSSLIVTCLR
jgi:hypothetical protein